MKALNTILAALVFICAALADNPSCKERQSNSMRIDSINNSNGVTIVQGDGNSVTDSSFPMLEQNTTGQALTAYSYTDEANAQYPKRLQITVERSTSGPWADSLRLEETLGGKQLEQLSHLTDAHDLDYSPESKVYRIVDKERTTVLAAYTTESVIRDTIVKSHYTLVKLKVIPHE